jgi:ribosomal protein L40E
LVYCWRCGEENDDEAVHCKKCGALIAALPLKSEEARFTEKSPLIGIFFGLLMILAGLIWLLEPYVPWLTWSNLWPILVILLGLYIILKALGMGR